MWIPKNEWVWWWIKKDQNSNFEGIYTNDLNEKEVGLYALKVIPKVGALSQADQGIWRDND